MARIPVTKTPKVYVGGQFIRSESGRVFPVREAVGGKRNPGSGGRWAVGATAWQYPAMHT